MFCRGGRTTWRAALSAGALLWPAVAFATVYDLNADWSATSNPNGPWELRQGTVALPFVEDWMSITGVAAYNPSSGHIAQPAFSDSGVSGSSNSTPAFFKTVVAPTNDGNGFDWQRGDIIAQVTASSLGGGEGAANAVFTSPAAGVATISGVLWSARTILGRVTNWQLLVNGVSAASGTLDGATDTDEANAETFSLSDVLLTANETVELLLSPTSDGDIVGLDMSVDLTEVPEPSSLSIMITMLAGMTVLFRRRLDRNRQP
jgi:hypothetical protein